MAITTLIVGSSGTGKSSSLQSLPTQETFIINILDKPLPFRGYKKNYTPLSSDGLTGNYYASDDHIKLSRIIKLINEKREDIKYLILDDFQYLMANEFMRRSSERGYDRFTDIARNAWSILKSLSDCRDNLFCFTLSHSELDNDNKYKIKTIGKMLDDKICLEGMFTVVLHTQVFDDKYSFLTQNNGTHIAKSPQGMFTEKNIPNDLKYVTEKMEKYYGDDEL